MAKEPEFARVGLIGAGLIGASLARALRARGLGGAVTAFDQDEAVAARAADIGVADVAAGDLASAVSDADLVVLATPVGASAAALRDIAAHAPPTALVIDVGSVKGAVAAAATATGPALFVPCHPIAGTERSGPEAGFAELFENRWCVLTPLDRPDPAYREAVERAARLWRGVGSMVEFMSPERHDLALAATSHLPHLIAFTMMGAVDDLETVTEAEIVKYSAGGFRDFTRIAASDPVMWRDVFLHNKQATLEVLGRFTEELALLQRAIRWGDAETLERSFARGRALRRAIVDAGQETTKPNFGRD
ncbi:MAG: prephenate/arogenate dehydrogenase family protein [Parvularculaceae bacterium]